MPPQLTISGTGLLNPESVATLPPSPSQQLPLRKSVNAFLLTRSRRDRALRSCVAYRLPSFGLWGFGFRVSVQGISPQALTETRFGLSFSEPGPSSLTLALILSSIGRNPRVLLQIVEG